jgi:hypothetical protein
MFIRETRLPGYMTNGGSVKWDKNFPYEDFITPDRDGQFLPILAYNIVRNGIVGKYKQ